MATHNNKLSQEWTESFATGLNHMLVGLLIGQWLSIALISLRVQLHFVRHNDETPKQWMETIATFPGLDIAFFVLFPLAGLAFAKHYSLPFLRSYRSMCVMLLLSCLGWYLYCAALLRHFWATLG